MNVAYGFKWVGACAAVVWLLAGPGHAVVINVDFQPGGAGGDQSTNFAGQGAIVDTGNDTWNVVAPDTGGEFNGEFGSGGFYSFAEGSYTSSVLMDSTGAATPVQVVVSKAPPAAPLESERAFAIASTNTSLANVATNAVALMSDFLITRNDGYDDNVVTIVNLSTGGLYNLYLYGAGDFSARNTRFVVGEISKTTDGVPEVTHDLTEGRDYVVFNGVVAMDGVITITYFNGGDNEEGNFNGLQLQDAEPVTIATATVANVAGLTFSSESDATYRLQYTSDLLATNWITAPTILRGTGGSMTAFDPAGFSTQKVYRISQD